PHRPYDFRPPPPARVPDHRTLAPGDEGQAGQRTGQSPIPETQADRRTRLRHHQERHRVYPLPPARPAKGRRRVAIDRAGLQLPASAPLAPGLNPSANPAPTPATSIRQAARTL